MNQLKLHFDWLSVHVILKIVTVLMRQDPENFKTLAKKKKKKKKTEINDEQIFFFCTSKQKLSLILINLSSFYNWLEYIYYTKI